MNEEVLSNVLLESGTNELELMEFKIAGKSFGINVAKVLEILRATEINPMPNANFCIEGIFNSRGQILTVVDLGKYLGLPSSPENNKDIFIITNFNKVSTAFHVHSVEHIHRILWTDIEKPDPAIYGAEDKIATGIAKINDRLITVLDFEKILSEIRPDNNMKIIDINTENTEMRNNIPILLVEDSTMLLRIVTDNLQNSGYKNLLTCPNGQEAYDKLLKYKESGKPIDEYLKCVVTDIEMPQMDGHRLTKLIKDDPYFKDLPVIVFSSLISDELMNKGIEVGANYQISKPDIDFLIATIDKIVL